MEIILIVFSLFLSQYFLYCEIRKTSSRLEFLLKNDDGIEAQLSSIRKHIDEVNVSLVAFNAEQRRTLLNFRDSLETTKPIKPNNWDSFREAFKGPARVEINERN